MSDSTNQVDLLGLTAEIVAAHVSKNPVSLNDLPGLIRQVHETLAGLGQPVPEAELERPQPAVPIKKSVTSGYLVCLEDGKKLKMIKRYLQNRYGLTPDQYRARWGLPNDYPMVAPEYAERRSNLAKSFGLGTQGREPRTTDAAAAEPAAPKRRGRPKKIAAGE